MPWGSLAFTKACVKETLTDSPCQKPQSVELSNFRMKHCLADLYQIFLSRSILASLMCCLRLIVHIFVKVKIVFSEIAKP